MEKPTIEEIKKRIQLVLDGKMSREEVSNWAEKWSNYFNYESGLSENDLTIWKYLDVLTGIDLKDSPTEYLHNEEDLKNWLVKF